jgi:hypothetical protein
LLSKILGIILAVASFAGLFIWGMPLYKWEKKNFPYLKYGVFFTMILIVLTSVSGCLAAPEMVSNKVHAYKFVKAAYNKTHAYFNHNSKNITTFHTKFNKKKKAVVVPKTKSAVPSSSGSSNGAGSTNAPTSKGQSGG